MMFYTTVIIQCKCNKHLFSFSKETLLNYEKCKITNLVIIDLAEIEQRAAVKIFAAQEKVA